ncbi:MAG: YtxH domain-containing protein [Gemmatimonadales bacterium]|jgi:gas vesicle protein
MSHDDRAVVVVEKSSGVGGFLTGLLLGAGIALLMAPRSGEETRAMLTDRVRRLRDAAEEGLDDLQDMVGDGYERAKATVEKKIDTARRSIDQKREGARSVVDAGRAAVRSARDELERRLAESRSGESDDENA